MLAELPKHQSYSSYIDFLKRPKIPEPDDKFYNKDFAAQIKKHQREKMDEFMDSFDYMKIEGTPKKVFSILTKTPNN